MSETDLIKLLARKGVSPWRAQIARWIESPRIQWTTTSVILFNAILMGMETSPYLMSSFGSTLKLLDKICLAYFVAEIVTKLSVYRLSFWRNGWNCFDFAVVAIALTPGAGIWGVLRSLRVLRVLRLLTVIPQLRKVVAAFMHAIPGLAGVIALMSIFYYTFGVLVTTLFAEAFPDWFGSLGKSFYTLFQIMTLESWSMGIVRPVMETFPWAWAIFIPFIVVATFTILNLFIGIIVSTMQELASLAEPHDKENATLLETLSRMERDLAALKSQLSQRN
ncbi:ion transporter [Pelagicoccus sp. SDUM812002]|uniref:ion transporter n=1 Tax=Pelagicoccus sp. SDUM812002 TaxID=3041266 RepID=UPI00281039C1|nr:ion transporter [Pelagicoccus sp. SDUM812002]MDQ8185010.1 ion transporter [Pelagicoccus sp. SDUM812002]